MVLGILRDFGVGSVQCAGALKSNLLGNRASLIQQADRLGKAVAGEGPIKEIDSESDIVVAKPGF